MNRSGPAGMGGGNPHGEGKEAGPHMGGGGGGRLLPAEEGGWRGKVG